MVTEQTNNDPVIVGAARTPFGSFGGVLKDVPGLELAVKVIKEVVRRSGRDDLAVDEVILGNCAQCEVKPLAPVVARQALLKAGLPPEVVSLTVDRACCSSLAAVQIAWKDILTGNADVVIAAGMENMSRIPYMVREMRWGTRMGNVVLHDDLHGMTPAEGYEPVAIDAGAVALEHGFTREDQDNWAYNSQMRYQSAFQSHGFKDEIVPLNLPQRRGPAKVFYQDEFPKPHTTLASLAKLNTIYGSATVTAGNAPGLDAGASAVLIMRREKAAEYGIRPLAEILTVQSVAAEPRLMATVPAHAIRKALAAVNLDVDDIDLIEINEAFAAVPLVSCDILANGDPEKRAKLLSITNVNGGAIAVGHPVGASGARIAMTLMFELIRRGGGIGAAAICGGLAQGDGAIIRVEPC